MVSHAFRTLVGGTPVLLGSRGQLDRRIPDEEHFPCLAFLVTAGACVKPPGPLLRAASSLCIGAPGRCLAAGGSAGDSLLGRGGRRARRDPGQLTRARAPAAR